MHFWCFNCLLYKKYESYSISFFSSPKFQNRLDMILFKFMTSELYWCNDTETAWSTTEKGSQVGNKNQCTSFFLWKSYEKRTPVGHLAYPCDWSVFGFSCSSLLPGNAHLRTDRWFGDHTLNNNFSLLYFFFCYICFFPVNFFSFCFLKDPKLLSRFSILFLFTLTGICLIV